MQHPWMFRQYRSCAPLPPGAKDAGLTHISPLEADSGSDALVVPTNRSPLEGAYLTQPGVFSAGRSRNDVQERHPHLENSSGQPGTETIEAPRQPSARPILAIGEILIDMIASDGAPTLEDATAFLARPGGAPANVAVALARLGVPSAFCGLVGNDAFGRRLRGVLADEGVDVSRLWTTGEAETTLAFAWTDDRGRGQFWLPRRAAADRLLAPDDIERAGIGVVAAIYVGSVALAAEPARSAILRAVELAAAAAVPIGFDVNLRPALWDDPAQAYEICQPIFARATLVKLSRDDAAYLLGQDSEPAALIAEFVSGMPAARALVISDGAAGCWYTCREDTAAPAAVCHVPAVPVQAVESTGAGDAFVAALIARMLARQWAPPDEADLQFAAAAGALATTRHGAIAALPTRAEVMALLERET